MMGCQSCGREIEPDVGRFCPHCGWPKPGANPDGLADRTAELSCPVCWTANPTNNRHCEGCGARLGPRPDFYRGPTRRGARAVQVGSVAFMGLVGLILLVRLLGGATEATESNGNDQPSTAANENRSLLPVAAEASSELSGDFAAANLIDGDPATVWNDSSLNGDGARLTFRFEPAATISAVVFENLSDMVRFRRNYRIREYEISFDPGTSAVTGVLEDSNEAQTVSMPPVVTSTVVINVLSTYPAENVQGAAPFQELALQGVLFLSG